jgi:phosphoribosylglycinamide formyltransferase-1
MLNITVLVSGGGTNLQAIIDAEKSGLIKNGHITAVISSKEGVFALERAKNNNIDSFVISKKAFATKEDYEAALLSKLKELNTDLVVLAGFLSILGSSITNEYKNRIINVHPALIPSFCGDGFYGMRVHEAVLKYGVKVTGATVHFVNDVTDGGAIILQKAVEVRQDDTPEILQQRVMKEAEWVILPKAVALYCDGRLEVCDGKVLINE